MSKRITVVSVLLAMALAACGGGGGGGGGGGDVALDDVLDELAAAWCHKYERCGEISDADACIASTDLGNDLLLATLAAAAERGSISYDGGAAGDCVQAVESAGCSFPDYIQLVLHGPCGELFGDGTLADGEDCVASSECTGDRCEYEPADCDNTVECCSGTCTTVTELGLGDDCSEGEVYCGEGFCGEEGTCQDFLAEGEPCLSTLLCAAGLVCDEQDEEGNGTCARPKDPGEDCFDSYSCAGMNAFCHPTSDTCAETVSIGGDCEVFEEGGDDCTFDAHCVDGACVAYPGEGEDCNEDEGVYCQGNLECRSGACAVAEAADACE